MMNRLSHVSNQHLLNHGPSSSKPWGDISMTQVMDYYRTHPPPHLRELYPLPRARLETEVFVYSNVPSSGRQLLQNRLEFSSYEQQGHSGIQPSSARHANNRNWPFDDGLITLDSPLPYRQRRPGPVDPRNLRPAPPLPEVLAYAPNSSRAARKMVKIEEVKLEEGEQQDIKPELRASIEEETNDDAPFAALEEDVPEFKDVKPLILNKFD